MKNPRAGGAEVFTDEVGKRLANRGWDVTLFTSMFKDGIAEEDYHEMKVIRRGGRKSVYLQAWRFYMERIRAKGNYDIVIDAINTVPFFTPIYARSSVVVPLVHQLTGEIFLRHFPLLVGAPLYALERLGYVRLYLKNSSVVLVPSQSIKQELMRMGFDSARVHVAEPGVNHRYYSPGRKSNLPTILYLNRVVPYKNVGDLVKAFKIVLEKMPQARLRIGGCRGTRYESMLVSLAKNLGLQEAVEFYPFASDELKRDFLRDSWVHVLPSTKEGWGISVMEAAACATPTVAYDVAGLRDSVVNGRTGVLAPFGSIESLARSLLLILENVEIRDAMAGQARERSTHFSWDSTASSVERALLIAANHSSGN